MDIAVFAEAPEAVSPATAPRGADPRAEHDAGRRADAPGAPLSHSEAGAHEIPRGEIGETGYTEVQELFGITRFGERMNLASRPAGTDGPAARPADPLPSVPAMTDRTADTPARGVRALHHHHPTPEPGRTPVALRERTRE
ncbi:hypothetical protein OIE69_23940 [Actinacidiphila glaucinigra]|nr:hypothetical protein [Actinacidiphila glaucinigra]WSD61736.1 hypothetical protein OIE69_23940 [Actinacidiphila glaucinigra]